MTVTHPIALRTDRRPPAYTYGSTTYRVFDEGRIDCPEHLEAEIAEALADRYGVEAETLLDGDSDVDADEDDVEAAGTCDTVKNDGDVCGRDLPCSYHSED